MHTDTKYPATSLQRQMWVLDQAGAGADTYLVGYAWQITGALDTDALASAVDALVARHDVLRTTFEATEGSVEAHIRPVQTGLLTVVDLGESVDREAELAARIKAELAIVFDLTQGPVFRARLYKVSATTGVLLLCMHHVAVDAGSHPVLVADLMDLYGGTALPPTMDGATVAELLSGTGLAAQDVVPVARIAHWRKALAGAPQRSQFPLDLPAGDRGDPRGSQVQVPLGADVSAAVVDVSRRLHVTPFVLLLAAHVLTMATWCRQDDVVTGIPFLHRDGDGLADCVGNFVSSLPIRVDLRDLADTTDLVSAVRGVVLDALDQRGIPFEELVRAVAPERHPDIHPLFQTYFSFEADAGVSALRLPGASVVPVTLDFAVAKFDLTVEIRQLGPDFHVAIEYRTSVFTRDSMISLGERFVDMLNLILADEPTRLAGLLGVKPAIEVPELSRESSTEEVPPLEGEPDPFEIAVAQAFSVALGQDAPATGVSFFHLGGTSLGATLLARRLSTDLGLRVASRDIFKTPSIKELSATIRDRAESDTAGPLAPRAQGVSR